MSSFADHLAADRRLALLRLLIEAQGAANESVLEMGLADLGHRAGLTRDAVREDLRWLEERALIAIDWVGDRLAVATITRRGADVARGTVAVEGVKRPDFPD